MPIESQVRAFAGAFVLAGTLLGTTVSPWFLLIDAFVGANLVQSAFTRFCPLEILLKRIEQRPA